MKLNSLFLIGVVIGVLAFVFAVGAMTAPQAAPAPQYPVLLYAEPTNPVQRPAAELYTDFPEEYVEEPAGAVFNGFNVEMTDWVVCVNETKVYSNPGENPDWYLYTLKDGEPVTVRELDRATRTFAAIKVARYVKFTDLCSLD
jgi:hypothetical protein